MAAPYAAPAAAEPENSWFVRNSPFTKVDALLPPGSEENKYYKVTMCLGFVSLVVTIIDWSVTCWGLLSFLGLSHLCVIFFPYLGCVANLLCYALWVVINMLMCFISMCVGFSYGGSCAVTAFFTNGTMIALLVAILFSVGKVDSEVHAKMATLFESCKCWGSYGGSGAGNNQGGKSSGTYVDPVTGVAVPVAEVASV